MLRVCQKNEKEDKKNDTNVTKNKNSNVKSFGRIRPNTVHHRRLDALEMIRLLARVVLGKAGAESELEEIVLPGDTLPGSTNVTFLAAGSFEGLDGVDFEGVV